MGLIAERVAAARRGEHVAVIGQMASGWAAFCDRQFPRGWCVLLSDPTVPTLNDLDPVGRGTFLTDMAALGDAVLQATGCRRINYAMYGNQEPELHAHVIPRYADERAELITQPIWLYPREQLDGRPFDPDRDEPLRQQIAASLAAAGKLVGEVTR